MGAGRKQFTYDYDTKAAAQQAAQSFEQRQRNLGENLGGCIFGCTNQTQEECIEGLVFGLPRAHWCYVQWITKGMPIFLFNYSNRKLHGIFAAESDGTWEINPEGWCQGSGTRTSFPSQTRVKVYRDCEPLTDREYRPILANCFAEDNHLLFELKRSEAQALCRLFDEKAEKKSGKRQASDKREIPNATGASSALAHGKKPFRPASPPPVSVWGAPAAASSRSTAASKPLPPPPTAADFPSLGVGAPPANGTAGKGWGQTAESSAKAGSASAPAGAQASKPARPAASAPAANGAAGPSHAEVERATQQPKAKDSPSVAAPREPAQKIPAEPDRLTVPDTAAAQPEGWDEGDPMPADTKPSNEVRAGRDITTQSSPNATGGPSTSARQQGTAAEGGVLPAAGAAETTANSEFAGILDSMHLALKRLDPASADAVWHAFSHVKSRLERATQDRIVLAHVADIFKAQKEALEALAGRQSHAIELLREETAALRRDLAFVGGHINITVAPVNPTLDDLPPLPRLPVGPSGAETAGNTAQAETSQQLGVGPANESMILFGGNDLANWIDTMDVFTPATRQWTFAGHMPSKRGYSAAAALPGHIYLIGGGGSGPNWNSDCLRFDVPSNEWFQMASMSEVRGNLAAVALGGKIYALGGGEAGKQTARTEVLDPDVNTWMPGKAMRCKRFGVAAGAVEGSIIAVGGFDGSHYLSSAERYDPREGFWEMLPELQCRRGGHQAVAVGAELHILGGWDSAEFLDGVEVFDVRKGAWRAAPPMKTSRAYFGAAHLGGVTYALGGMVNKSEANELVEYYDAGASKWKAMMVEPSEEASSRKRVFVAPCKVIL